jgi:hypothetical protein
MLILSVPLVIADESTESFSVYTERKEYIVGEVINIYAKANTIGPGQTIMVTDVVVYDSANMSVAEWRNLSIVLTDTTTQSHVGTIVVESEGGYTVSAVGTVMEESSGGSTGGMLATGYRWILRAMWCFICRFFKPHVIPEVPFGTIASVMSFLGATGFYVTRKFKRKRITQM